MAERPLTAGERQMLSDMFGSSIDLDVLRISDQQRVPGQDVPITPTGTKIYWPSGLVNNPSFPDFSAPYVDTWSQSTFMHEATHLWQSQQTFEGPSAGAWSGILDRMTGQNESNYSLSNVTTKTQWGDLAVEQQAEVVRNIYLLQHGFVPTNGALSLQDYQRILGNSGWELR